MMMVIGLWMLLSKGGGKALKKNVDVWEIAVKIHEALMKNF